MRNVSECHGHATIETQRNGSKIAQRLQIAGRTNHELGFCQFQDTPAGFTVRPFDGRCDLLLCHAPAGHAYRVEYHLVLLDHAADGCDFRHVGQSLELIAQEPVLQRAQLREVMPARAIHQRILVDPADTRGIWA